MTLPIPTTTLPMEARVVPALPRGKTWRYEPKWDGFRCLAYRDGKTVTLRSKSGKPLERYFPDIVAALETLDARNFILDGELVIEIDGNYNFDDLQLRLHPAASRVAKLSQATPATFILFDLLMTERKSSLVDHPFADRRLALEEFFAAHCANNPRFQLSPQTASLKTARNWLAEFGGRIDGLMAKNGDDTYHSGERQMEKYKPVRTADCVVGGFRYATNSDEVGSLLLGLYDDDGKLNHVGFTSSIAKADRKALTAKLEKLISPPGFTGNAPGGPSRWSTDRTGDWQPLKPDLVVEVGYNQVTADRFRHGCSLLRWRPDKAPRQCKMDQLRQPRPAILAAE